MHFFLIFQLSANKVRYSVRKIPAQTRVHAEYFCCSSYGNIGLIFKGYEDMATEYIGNSVLSTTPWPLALLHVAMSPIGNVTTALVQYRLHYNNHIYRNEIDTELV